MIVTLFTTAGCHLCDLAEAILLTIPSQYDLEITQIEIGDSDELVERYGIRIPVVRFSDESEIGWPFQQNDIESKLIQLQP